MSELLKVSKPITSHIEEVKNNCCRHDRVFRQVSLPNDKRLKCMMCEGKNGIFADGEVVFLLPSSCYKSRINIRYAHVKCVLFNQDCLPPLGIWENLLKIWIKNEEVMRI